MVSGNMPAFSAYLSTQQSVTTAVFTKVTCQTEEFDTASAYDNATNYRFTPLVAGYYQVSGNLDTSSSGSVTYGRTAIYKNGSRYKDGTLGNGTTTPNVPVSCLVYLNGSTDYIELYAAIAGVTPVISVNSVYGTFFQAVMVRSA